MSQTQVQADESHTPRRRAWLWPGIVVGLLCVHTFAMLIVIFIATSDPSHAIVPDYHAKAVNWEQRQAEVRASAALGWAYTIETSEAADKLGQRTLSLSLRDADDKPLTGATVKIEAYHHARANDVITAELTEPAPGQYVALMKLGRDGLWNFAIEIKQGDDHFIDQTNQRVGLWRVSTP